MNPNPPKARQGEQIKSASQQWTGDPVSLLFSYGFRIFFVLAALSAITWMGLWARVLWGAGGSVVAVEHAHEMAFGYALAVFAGFFLTAAPRWTNTEHLFGIPLIVLVAFWAFGRSMAWFPEASQWAAVGDAGLLLALFVAVGFPIARSRSTRNYAFPLLLLAIAGFDIGFHLGVDVHHMLFSAIRTMVLILVIFAGRVTPMFTRNALVEADLVRGRDWRDNLAIGLATLWWVTAVIPPSVGIPSYVPASAALLAGLANWYRMFGWASWRTRRSPILWVLHLGYFWIVVAMLLDGVVPLWLHPMHRTAALHAMTAGALGTMTLGMMARVSLGHTNRPLHVHPLISVSFGAMVLAGFLRVIASFFPPAMQAILGASALLWASCFIIFLAIYLPILTAPDVDRSDPKRSLRVING